MLTGLFWDTVDSFAGVFDGFFYMFTGESTSKADRFDTLGSMKILNRTKSFLEGHGCRTRQPGRTWLLGPGACSGTNQKYPFCSRQWYKSNKRGVQGSNTRLQEAFGAASLLHKRDLGSVLGDNDRNKTPRQKRVQLEQLGGVSRAKMLID